MFLCASVTKTCVNVSVSHKGRGGGGTQSFYGSHRMHRLTQNFCLSQRAQSYRDAEFYGSHRMHRLTQNFYFAPLSFTLRTVDASVTCVLCEFCVFCVRIKICPYVLLSKTHAGCISLTQRAQSYRDAEFYGSHRMHRLTQNFCFSQRARRGRGVLCEFCVFCVQ